MSRGFGLTEREKAGAKKLLGHLATNELRSLAQTVTNRQIAVASRQEALRAIVTYTGSATELLKRRKVKREILFQYLTTEGAVVSTQSEKHQLVQYILQLWGSQVDGPLALEVEDEDQPEPPQQATQVEPVDKLSENLRLARSFVIWFFKMLNAHHPASTETASDLFGPQHFFNDCCLKLVCTAPTRRFEEFHGSQMVSQRLLAFVREENVKFNPNVEADGLTGMSSPHGLRIVTVCGTVHHNGSVVGLFEQQFGLVRDPDMQDNYRIKFVNLKFGVGQELKRPTLEATETLLAIHDT